MNRFQRAAGRCEAVRQTFDGITSEQRTEILHRMCRLRRVRPITRSRVPVNAGTRVVPQRLFRAFVSYV